MLQNKPRLVACLSRDLPSYTSPKSRLPACIISSLQSDPLGPVLHTLDILTVIRPLSLQWPLLLTWFNFTNLAWVSNHMPGKVWDEITYPFPNFNGATVEVWEWISSFIPHYVMDAITYPCWDWGIDHGREGVTATTPEWFVARRRDVPRAQLEGRPHRTTNHEGVVAVTPDRPWSIPTITWLNNVILHILRTKYVQNHHQIERRRLLASIVTSRISP